MAIREFTGVALLALMATPAAAQKRGDQATLVFTVSGAYIQGKNLWGTQHQPIQDGVFTDFYNLHRNIKSTLGASLAGTYYPGATVGFTAEAFLMGMGYDDGCALDAPPQSVLNAEVCTDIDKQDKSAAAAALSAGAIFRIGSRESISPFARVGAGLLFTNQSSILTQGVSASNAGALLIVYEDDKRSRVLPAFTLGIGTTFAINRGYHLRWEVRDNYVGVAAVTGTTSGAHLIPPHETVYKHLISVHIGLDVVLERDRGRRY
jgi:opacity protein-like surface antigen